MNIESEKFLNEIFDIESKRILHDIKEYTPLKSVIEEFSEEQKSAALKYIIDVFKECYLVGDLKIHIEVEALKMKAYAMYFIFDQTKTIYLHFLFVSSEHRGKGVGKSILSRFKDHALDTYLLCDFTKVEYYKSCGFRFMSKANTLLGDNFKMSKYLYHSLSIMTDSESSTQAPIFYLNDSDLRIISGVSEIEFQKLASLEPKI
ncbi:GNAT family N-acetyltransferase [Vibrio parahaemolyticus]|uniref:GNAT family N-acetyltransferase n=1 Tax=Vibrio parahaemolyticus TaxID=670 RepID=UPI00226AADB8|nr:GNAT family N-acetyltransferase [Vibrio parahaemolyticus]MCX8875356.1 GNAT family N-acetyltransferase [Vibrio parahaemolyticus]